MNITDKAINPNNQTTQKRRKESKFIQKIIWETLKCRLRMKIFASRAK